MAELEGAEAAMAFASGMGAICAVVLGLCNSGSHIVAQRQCYGGTTQLLAGVCPRFGIEVTLRRCHRTRCVRRGGASRRDHARAGRDAGQPATRSRRPRRDRRAGRPDQGRRLHAAPPRWANNRCVTASISWSIRPPRRWPVTTTQCSVWWRANVSSSNGSGASPCCRAPRRRPTTPPTRCAGLRTLGVRLRQQTATAPTLAAALEAHPAVRSTCAIPALASHPQARAGSLASCASPAGLLSFESRRRARSAGARFVENAAAVPSGHLLRRAGDPRRPPGVHHARRADARRAGSPRASRPGTIRLVRRPGGHRATWSPTCCTPSVRATGRRPPAR